MAASYPSALKTFTDQVDGVDWVLAADMNAVQQEIQAIEAELGTDPAGSLATLKARLAVALDDDGTLKLTAITEHTGISDNNIVEVDGSPNADEAAVWTANGLKGTVIGISDDNIVEVDGAPNDDELAEWTANGLKGRAIGIADTNILRVDGTVADDDYMKATASGLEGKTLAEMIADMRTAGVIGIDDNDLVEIDSSSITDDEIARFTANGLESRSNAEMKAQLAYLTDLSDDTTPTLGGDLDANSKDITGIKQMGYSDTYDAGTTSSAAHTIDWNNGNQQKLKLSHNAVDLSLTDPTAGDGVYRLTLIGDGTLRTNIDADHDADCEWADDAEPSAYGSTNNEIIGILNFVYCSSETPKYVVSGVSRGAA